MTKLNAVLRDVPNSFAPSTNRISDSALRHLGEIFRKQLLETHNKFRISGFFPVDWKVAIVSTLLKPGKSQNLYAPFSRIALGRNVVKSSSETCAYSPCMVYWTLQTSWTAFVVVCQQLIASLTLSIQSIKKILQVKLLSPSFWIFAVLLTGVIIVQYFRRFLESKCPAQCPYGHPTI